MLDHIIFTVSNIERSLAFYEVALEPLNASRPLLQNISVGPHVFSADEPGD
jgi:catechol 2,3-dioxygenase-like lactoylglutathione lyase family enzyme